jgi:hypothetical protein
MIWLAWRQLRAQAAVVFGALALVAIFVLYSGLRVRHLYTTSGISTCAKFGDCDAVINSFTSRYAWQQTVLESLLILCLPAVIGVFWGAPLVAREFETGTFRLAWTQSVTRTRWLAAKVAVVGTASVCATGLLSWMVTWWFTPMDRYQNKFSPAVFGERDIAPIGYAAFAFALGLTAGLLIRRTLAAMAVTLVGYIAARVVVLLWVRPHFATPLHFVGPLQGNPVAKDLGTFDESQVWTISNDVIDPSGHVTHNIRIVTNDPCVDTHTCLGNFHQVISYQPRSRYWPFQWDETLLFTGIAAILVGFCFWWINGHRLRRGRRAGERPVAPVREGEVVRQLG